MKSLIKKAEKLAKKMCEQNDKDHNWQHVEDVWSIVQKLSKHFPEADLELLKLAVIFHDCDYNSPETHHEDSADFAKKFLIENDYPEEKIKQIYQIMLDHRGKYRRANGESETIEGKIIYDADKFRLAVSDDAHEKYYPLLYLDETRKLVDVYMKKKINYKDKYLRALADYQNLQKESEEKRKDYVQYANGNLIIEMLPILDNFKAAFNQIPDEEKDSSWVVGFGFIKKQLEDFLKQNGVEEIKTVGEPFDPSRHEAVHAPVETIHESSPETDNNVESEVITKEIKAGYTLHGKVIQVAKVIVNSE